MSVVLVTGGSGYLGSHILVQLLAAGHTVRTTLRSLTREPEVRSMLARAGVEPGGRFTCFAADLTRDDGWAEAVSGCDYVLHVASPMPAEEPKDPDELIVPAREGVLRVLAAARDAHVKRVVFTSTCGAIYYGHPAREAAYDETSWSNLEGEASSYVRSKIIAERTAWEFMAREGGALELAVVNPAGIFGPVLSTDLSSSIEIVTRLLNGMPGCLQIYFGVVDVRDTADLHLRAMTHPEAKGERFIAVSGKAVSMVDIAHILKAHLGEQARKVPTRALPNWFVRFIARFSSELKSVVPLLGNVRNATSAKAERVLGWRARPITETILDTAKSLRELGVVA